MSSTSVPSPRVPAPPKPGSPEDDNASVGYTTLALTHLALALPLFFRPAAASSYLFNQLTTPNKQGEVILGILASSLFGSAATAVALKEGADSHSLDQPWAERLQAGLMLAAASAFGIQLIHGSDVTNNGLGLGAAAAALTFAVPATRTMATPRSRKRLGNRLIGLLDAPARLFSFNSGFKVSTALYAALTPLFIGSGLAYMFAPDSFLGNAVGAVIKGRDREFLWKHAGNLLVQLGLVTYTLKEKADAGELSDRSSRVLNIGLLGTSLFHLAVLGGLYNEGTGGEYLPAVMGTWGAAAVSSLIGLSSAAEKM